MNKQDLVELVKKYGHPKEDVSVGDKVLVDGAHSGGEYVTLCTVLDVDKGIAKLQEEHTYYLNGGEFPERKVSSVSVDYFKKSIAQHIQEGRDVFQMIIDAFEDDDKTQGEQGSGGNG